MKCISSCLAAAVRDCLRTAELSDHLSADEVKVRAGGRCGTTTQPGILRSKRNIVDDKDAFATLRVATFERIAVSS